MLRTEIPPKLLTVMLHRARLARRDLVPGTSSFKDTDVAYLAEYWSGRLFRISLDREDSLLEQSEMDELCAVMKEITEVMACLGLEDEGEYALDGTTFEETSESILAFLTHAD